MPRVGFFESADLWDAFAAKSIEKHRLGTAEWYKTYGAVAIPKVPLSLVLPYSVFIAAMEHADKPIL